MTRAELAKLKDALRYIGPPQQGGFWLGHSMLQTIIEEAEAEHEAEDRHNDWAELAEHPHQIAAE